MRDSQRLSESIAPDRNARLSTHSSETEAIEVITVSHKPQRYAAAAITNKKNRKKGLLCPVVNSDITPGKTTSAEWTSRRNGTVVCWRERNRNVITSP